MAQNSMVTPKCTILTSLKSGKLIEVLHRVILFLHYLHFLHYFCLPNKSRYSNSTIFWSYSGLICYGTQLNPLYHMTVCFQHWLPGMSFFFLFISTPNWPHFAYESTCRSDQCNGSIACHSSQTVSGFLMFHRLNVMTKGIVRQYNCW